MRNLLNFLAKYNSLIIFIVLEGIAFYLLSTGNNYQNARLVKGIRGLSHGIETRVNNARTYFRLREINRSLENENAYLSAELERLAGNQDRLFFYVTDTVLNQQYTYTSAEVVNNSVNRQKNFFTINKGSKQGISVDMAVTSENCVAGVIVGCSNNYSVAMSLLNLDFRLSARLRKSGYFGSLNWDGASRYNAILSEIPLHVTFGIGDTVETTGYSAIFPEGVLIGTVSNFEKAGGDFYRIEVTLAADFRKLNSVSVIGNLKKQEQTELEKQFQ